MSFPIVLRYWLTASVGKKQPPLVAQTEARREECSRGNGRHESSGEQQTRRLQHRELTS